MNKVSLKYVFFYGFEDGYDKKRLYHSGHIHRASLQYVFFYGFEDGYEKLRLHSKGFSLVCAIL